MVNTDECRKNEIAKQLREELTKLIKDVDERQKKLKTKTKQVVYGAPNSDDTDEHIGLLPEVARKDAEVSTAEAAAVYSETYVQMATEILEKAIGYGNEKQVSLTLYEALEYVKWCETLDKAPFEENLRKLRQNAAVSSIEV